MNSHKHQNFEPAINQFTPETKKMDNDSIESKGRALLRHAAQQIRRSETSKFRRISAGTLAIAVAAFQIVPAFATIDNTVTASGTGPGGVAVTGTANANVGVIPANPKVTVVKTITFTTDTNSNSKADAGDVLAYSFKVKNTGNVTLKDVKVTDANDGVGAAVVVSVPAAVSFDAAPLGDSSNASTTKFDFLKPGDEATFTGSYTVVAGDIASAGGGTGTGANAGAAEPDGYLDDKATVTADYFNGTTTTSVTNNDKKSVQLNINPVLLVTKTASKTTNVIVGDVITYTYTVKNNGNTPITGINLNDTHSGLAGIVTPVFASFNVGATSTNSGNTITLLQLGDTATYTATYTVTQNDIDLHQ